MVTLWRVSDPQGAAPFDRCANVGLHHLALKVTDKAALTSVYEKLSAERDVAIEFGPEPIREGSPFHHFICAMPGGVRIEFATADRNSIHEAER